MTRLLTLVVLALTLVSTQVEARSKRIHVTAKIVQQDFTGSLGSPALGDQLISSVELSTSTMRRWAPAQACVRSSAFRRLHQKLKTPS